MSLAACPDCGNSCSLLAQTCPSCGRPFEKGELERIALASVPSKVVDSKAAVNDNLPARDELTTFNVILRSSGANRIAVIGILRELKRIGLWEAKNLVDKTPVTISYNVSASEADQIKSRLEHVGANVEVCQISEESDELSASVSEPLKRSQSNKPIGENVSPPVPAANNNAAAIGCVVIALLFILLAIVCVSGGSNSRANCEQDRLRENQRRYDRAQRDPNYNPTYVGPCQ